MAYKAMFALEDRCTPLQLKGMLPELRGLTGFGLKVCQKSYVMTDLETQPAQRYERREVAPDVVFYRGEGERSQKSLIITFCGRSQRPNMAWSLFLQNLPSDLFDVVILCDQANSHYSNGITGYASDMLSLGQRLAWDVEISAYRKVYCYGTSSGGFPAIRLGLLCGAYSSIAIGGVFAWPIYRLQQRVAFQAFDPICTCYSPRGGRVLLVHGSNEKDARESEHARRVLKAKKVRITATIDHNVNHQMYLAGSLMDFHQRLFEFAGKSFYAPH